MAADHPAFELAKRGIIIPRSLGDADLSRLVQNNRTKALEQMAIDHQLGDTFTVFTSWSDSRGVADYHACKTGKPGVVLVKKLTKEELSVNAVVPEEVFADCEVLLIGDIMCDDVLEPQCPGDPTCF